MRGAVPWGCPAAGKNHHRPLPKSATVQPPPPTPTGRPLRAGGSGAEQHHGQRRGPHAQRSPTRRPAQKARPPPQPRAKPAGGTSPLASVGPFCTWGGRGRHPNVQPGRGLGVTRRADCRDTVEGGWNMEPGCGGGEGTGSRFGGERGEAVCRVHTGEVWGHSGADAPHPHPQTPHLLPVPAAAEGHGPGPAPHAAARPRGHRR